MSCLFILCFRCFPRRKFLPKTTAVVWKSPRTQTIQLIQIEDISVPLADAINQVQEHTIVYIKNEQSDEPTLDQTSLGGTTSDTHHTTSGTTSDTQYTTIDTRHTTSGTTSDTHHTRVVSVPCPSVHPQVAPVAPVAPVAQVAPVAPSSNFSDFVIVNSNTLGVTADMDSESDDTREYVDILFSVTIPLNETSSGTFPPSGTGVTLLKKNQ